MSDSNTPHVRLRELAQELRDRNAIVADLEDRMREERARIRTITTSEMVDAMHELDVSSITIDADGNQPPMIFEMGNHISASIPVDWEEQRRETAFDLIPDELLKIRSGSVLPRRGQIKRPQQRSWCCSALAVM